MTDVGLDYAWDRPDLDVAWAAGYRFVCRYVSYDTTGKNITATELQALRARGFEVALNWEWQATDQLGGASLGTQHATEAVRQANALGYPAGCTIYFSADFDATEAQQATVNAYMAAAGTVVHAAGYRIGIYGGYYVVGRAFDAGVTDDGWQTYAWSGGQWEPRAAIRQDQNGITVGGAICDHNTRVGPTYLMGGQSTTEGWLMALTNDQQDDMYRRICNIDSFLYYGEILGQETVPAGQVRLGFGVGQPPSADLPHALMRDVADMQAKLGALVDGQPAPVLPADVVDLVKAATAALTALAVKLGE